MITGMTHATLIVKDQDEALRWFTELLGLELRTNSDFGEGQRFVTVGAKGQDVEIVLHRPPGTSDGGAGQPASSVHGFVFSTDDCRKTADELRQRGVKITGGPEGGAVGRTGAIRGPLRQRSCNRRGPAVHAAKGVEAIRLC